MWSDIEGRRTVQQGDSEEKVMERYPRSHPKPTNVSNIILDTVVVVVEVEIADIVPVV